MSSSQSHHVPRRLSQFEGQGLSAHFPALLGTRSSNAAYLTANLLLGRDTSQGSGATCGRTTPVLRACSDSTVRKAAS